MRTLTQALVLLALLLTASCSVSRHDLHHETLTPVYDVDKIYLSMQGPQFTDKKVRLLPEIIPELLWVTGYQAIMVGEDGATQKPQQFMCHNTLSIHRPLDQHRKLFGAPAYGTRRLFTLSQGQYEVELPDGFGIPVISTEQLMLQSQVLNLNSDAIGEKVRHKVNTRFLRDKDVKPDATMRPLCMFPSGIAVRIGDPSAAESPDDPELGCAIAADHLANGETHDGEPTTGHWVLEPGKDIRQTDLGRQFPFDTRIHYIAVHVHPYAQSFEFRDRTTNESLWTAQATQTKGSIGLEALTNYSSAEGIKVYKDHDYEIISTYNNTSGESQTAMAFMFFYVEDKLWNPPTEKALLSSDESFCKPNTDPKMLR